jgi:hypothetical protein
MSDDVCCVYVSSKADPRIQRSRRKVKSDKFMASWLIGESAGFRNREARSSNLREVTNQEGMGSALPVQHPSSVLCEEVDASKHIKRAAPSKQFSKKSSPRKSRRQASGYSKRRLQVLSPGNDQFGRSAAGAAASLENSWYLSVWGSTPRPSVKTET